jgi:hypothetical protein
MHIKDNRSSLRHVPRNRSMPQRTRGHLAKEFPDMAVLMMIATWLALQLPTGILLGRFLERQPLLVPVRANR